MSMPLWEDAAHNLHSKRWMTANFIRFCAIFCQNLHARLLVMHQIHRCFFFVAKLYWIDNNKKVSVFHSSLFSFPLLQCENFCLTLFSMPWRGGEALGGETSDSKGRERKNVFQFFRLFFSRLMNLCVTSQSNSPSDKKNYKICCDLWFVTATWLVCDSFLRLLLPSTFMLFGPL